MAPTSAIDYSKLEDLCFSQARRDKKRNFSTSFLRGKMTNFTTWKKLVKESIVKNQKIWLMSTS
jgi:hypothetical protein